MRKKPETPEQHVHESVSRQKKAAENVAKTAERVAKKAESKAEILAHATDLLSNRVVTLADAVQTNNARIDEFQKELNRKPDDEELKFFEGRAKKERNTFLVYAVTTAILSAIVAGYVAYRAGAHRCEVNAQNISTLVKILESTPQLQTRYAAEIADLKSNRNDC